MPGQIETFLAAWLNDEKEKTIGEIVVKRSGENFLLHHRNFEISGDARPTHHLPTDARSIAKYDDADAFRPLKSAPTLITDWLLELNSIRDVREALDYFYPAAISNWLRKSENENAIVHLRDTLNRQTGMYRVTGLIRDSEAIQLVSDACAPERCQRRILWELSPDVHLDLPTSKRKTPRQTADDLSIPEIPVLCCEACNVLVAAARKVVKTRMTRENE